MRIVVLNGMLFFWLISPESLTLLGNAAGGGALAYGVMMLASAMLIAAALPTSGRMAGSVGRFGLLAAWRRGSGVLGFAAIGGTALFGATGMLVSAGFTFNEVFFYRFPNFTFSSLLLLLVVILQLLPDGFSAVVQGVLVSVTICCLMILVAAGIVAYPAPFGDDQAQTSLRVSSLLPLLLVFAGFEQTFAGREPKVSGTMALLCYFTLIVLLTAWGMISAAFVSPQRLVQSTLPHMTAAHGILEQAGRIVMGVAVIAGSCAAANGLFGLARDHLARSAGTGTNVALRRAVPVVLAICIGFFWYIGLAGSPRLEVFIRGSLLLWLLYGGLSALVASRPAKRTFWPTGRLNRPVGGLLALCSLLIGISYGHYKVMGLFLAGLLTGSLLCIMVVGLMHGTMRQNDKK